MTEATRTTNLALAIALACSSGTAQDQIWGTSIGTLGADSCTDISANGADGLFVCGNTVGDLAGPSAGAGDAWFARFDAAGKLDWIAQLGSSSDDDADTVSPDGSGGLYIGGKTWGDLGGPNVQWQDVWFARYDSAGLPLWLEHLGSSGIDVLQGSAPDGLGGCFLAGYSSGDMGGPNLGQEDVWIARYDGNGNQMWIQQVGTSSLDLVGGMVPDGSGGFFIGGTTSGSFGGATLGSADAWLARYDSAGLQIWIRQFGSSASDLVHAMCANGSGGAYLVGTTTGSLGGPPQGGNDGWVVSYDGSGSQQWLAQLGGPFSDSAFGAAEDGSGGVYLGGLTTGSMGPPASGGDDCWLAHYSGAGNQLSLTQFGTPTDEYITALAGSPLGGVFLAGRGKGDHFGTPNGWWDGFVARYGDCGVDTVQAFCVATVNSTGQAASIGYTGSTSLTQNDLVLTVEDCPPGQIGIFLFGSNQTQLSFGDGWLCTSSNVKRLLPAVIITPAGTGMLPVDFTDSGSSASLITAGSAYSLQFWYRDPAGGPNGFNLSDALEAFICP